MTLNKTKVIIIIAISLGFVYRIYLSSLAQSQPIFDMSAYHKYATAIAAGNLVTDCCLWNVGYSAFLGTIYKLFGSDNINAVRTAQSIIDVSTAFLIYLIAVEKLGKKSAFFSFLLYLTNPLTSSYTGLRLGEIITIFYITLLTYIVTRKTFRKNFLLWLITGIILGLLLFTKQSLFYFVIALTFTIGFLILKRLNKFLFIIISFAGIIIASSYTLSANYKNFKKISLVPPYNNAWTQLYTSFYYSHWPEIDSDYGEFKSLSQGYIQPWTEYKNATLVQKLELEEKNKKLFLRKLQKDWLLFIGNTTRNIIWIWDKTHLYYYHDPFYPQDKLIIRVMNILWLVLFIIGFTAYIKKNSGKIMNQELFLITILLFLYVTFFFTLVNNEQRLSLYFYPFIFLFGGLGITHIIDTIRRIRFFSEAHYSVWPFRSSDR